MSFGMKNKQKNYFKYFHFIMFSLKNQKSSIYQNIKLLHELPFYDEISVVKKSKAFKGYPRSYKVEMIDTKDLSAELEDQIKL